MRLGIHTWKYTPGNTPMHTCSPRCVSNIHPYTPAFQVLFIFIVSCEDSHKHPTPIHPKLSVYQIDLIFSLFRPRGATKSTLKPVHINLKLFFDRGFRRVCMCRCYLFLAWREGLRPPTQKHVSAKLSFSYTRRQFRPRGAAKS